MSLRMKRGGSDKAADLPPGQHQDSVRYCLYNKDHTWTSEALPEGKTIIGRSAQPVTEVSFINLESPRSAISRAHAVVVVCQNGDVWIEDNGSTNGTVMAQPRPPTSTEKSSKIGAEVEESRGIVLEPKHYYQLLPGAAITFGDVQLFFGIAAQQQRHDEDSEKKQKNKSQRKETPNSKVEEMESCGKAGRGKSSAGKQKKQPTEEEEDEQQQQLSSSKKRKSTAGPAANQNKQQQQQQSSPPGSHEIPPAPSFGGRIPPTPANPCIAPTLDVGVSSQLLRDVLESASKAPGGPSVVLPAIQAGIDEALASAMMRSSQSSGSLPVVVEKKLSLSPCQKQQELFQHSVPSPPQPQSSDPFKGTNYKQQTEDSDNIKKEVGAAAVAALLDEDEEEEEKRVKTPLSKSAQQRCKSGHTSASSIPYLADDLSSLPPRPILIDADTTDDEMEPKVQSAMPESKLEAPQKQRLTASKRMPKAPPKKATRRAREEKEEEERETKKTPPQRDEEEKASGRKKGKSNNENSAVKRKAKQVTIAEHAKEEKEKDPSPPAKKTRIEIPVRPQKLFACVSGASGKEREKIEAGVTSSGGIVMEEWGPKCNLLIVEVSPASRTPKVISAIGSGVFVVVKKFLEDGMPYERIPEYVPDIAFADGTVTAKTVLCGISANVSKKALEGRSFFLGDVPAKQRAVAREVLDACGARIGKKGDSGVEALDGDTVGKLYTSIISGTLPAKSILASGKGK